MSIFTKITATIMTTCMLFVFSGCGSSEFAEKTGMNQSQESTALAVFKDNGIGELKNVTKYKDNPPTFAAKYGSLLLRTNKLTELCMDLKLFIAAENLLTNYPIYLLRTKNVRTTRLVRGMQCVAN